MQSGRAEAVDNSCIRSSAENIRRIALIIACVEPMCM